MDRKKQMDNYNGLPYDDGSQNSAKRRCLDSRESFSSQTKHPPFDDQLGTCASRTQGCSTGAISVPCFSKDNQGNEKNVGNPYFLSPPMSDDPNSMYKMIVIDWTTCQTDPPLSANLMRRVELPSPACRNKVEAYRTVDHLGRGTFGDVNKCVKRAGNSNVVIALKRVFLEMDHDGFPITTIREIRILSTVDHPNIVRLLEVFVKQNTKKTSPDVFYLAFECCSFDLCSIVCNSTISIKQEEILLIAFEMLSALMHLHVSGVLHRDLKPANIFLSAAGHVKIGDFGLAKLSYNMERFPSDVVKEQRHTIKVVTLWYRAPEILMGCNRYNNKIDIWSTGCVIGELFTRRPLFKAEAEMQLLSMIASICGPMTPQTWPSLTTYEHYRPIKFKDTCRRRVREELKIYVENDDVIDLIDHLLTLDPTHRPDAEGALDYNAFFSCDRVDTLESLMSRHHESEGYNIFLERKRRAIEAMRTKQQEAAAMARENQQSMQNSFMLQSQIRQQQIRRPQLQNGGVAGAPTGGTGLLNVGHNPYGFPLLLSSNRRNVQLARRRAQEQSRARDNREYRNRRYNRGRHQYQQHRDNSHHYYRN
ncbi:hypothetical protein ACOME3_009812 [Neoechinorhynchus agilis]